MTHVLSHGAAAIMIAAGAITIISSVGPSPAQAMVQPPIVHGRDTSVSEFGFIVAVGSPYRSAGRLYVQQDCAGTLVTPLKVITAAHCLWDRSSSTNRGANDIAVASGLDRRHQQAVEVATAVYHPDYDGTAGTYENDIAVLTLKQPILGTPRMLPVVRGVGPTQADLDSGLTAAGADLATAGWGSTTSSNEGEPEVATAADVNLFGANTCDGASSKTDKEVATIIDGITFYRYIAGEIVDDVMICAMGVNDSGQIVDSCGGDSGGPLTGGTGSARRLVGIVSWGPEPDRDSAAGPDDVCAIHYAGVYTRVSAFSGPGEFLSQQGMPVTNPAGAPSRPSLTAATRSSSSQLDLRGVASPVGKKARWIQFTVTDSTTKKSMSCTAAVGADRTASCSITRLELAGPQTVTAAAYDAAGDASPRSVTLALLGAPVFGSVSVAEGTTTLKVPVSVGSAPGITRVSTVVTCTKADTVVFAVTVTAGKVRIPFADKGSYSCRAVTTYTSGKQRLTTLPSGILPVRIV